jgi:hypothetical protein
LFGVFLLYRTNLDARLIDDLHLTTLPSQVIKKQLIDYVNFFLKDDLSSQYDDSQFPMKRTAQRKIYPITFYFPHSFFRSILLYESTQWSKTISSRFGKTTKTSSTCITFVNRFKKISIYLNNKNKILYFSSS